MSNSETRSRPSDDEPPYALPDFLGPNHLAWRNNRRLVQEEIVRQVFERAGIFLRGIGGADSVDAAPPFVWEIIEAAMDSPSKQFQELYARLLGAALEPKRSRWYRRELLKITRAMAVIDAAVWVEISTWRDPTPIHRPDLAANARVSADELEFALQSLERLGLIQPLTAAKDVPALTPLGMQFALFIK